MTLLTLLACGLATRFAKVRLSQVGLSSWQRWSQTERWYFLQTVPLAILVFAFINTASMRALWSHPNLGEVGLFFFVPQMIWGLYQEVLYRGILQNELVRRWGRGWGIGVSNLIYTFGPLHAYHFLAAQRHPSHLWIFAAIFSIGLFFAILFKRSGNLWIVAVLHGLGDWFLVGLAKALKIFQ